MTGPLEDDDGNAYKLPYPEKAVNRRHRDLARSLSCPPPSLYDKALSSFIKVKVMHVI